MGAIKYVGRSILDDNSLALFNLLFSILYYSDPGYKIEIFEKEEEVICHVTPSITDFKQPIINNLLFLNKVVKNTRIRFSSSLKLSKIISFRIPFEKKPLLSL